MQREERYKGGWSFGFPRPLVSEVHMVRAHAQELARKVLVRYLPVCSNLVTTTERAQSLV